jgi:hypothetical protein
MIVAIHQPNYLPWLGYFHKAMSSGVFVFFDHVQLPQGRSYTQRVHILGPAAEPAWLTVPLMKRGRSGQAIMDAECDDTGGWRAKHLRTLQHAYGKHPFFTEVFPLLEELIGTPSGTLGEMNVRAVTAIAGRLGAACRFERSSRLELPDVQRSELLAAVARAVGGDEYLFGAGGAGYQEAELFARAGVRLRAQGFRHPAYPQKGTKEFLPGLSVVDALFNLGFDGTRALLEGVGVPPPAP